MTIKRENALQKKLWIHLLKKGWQCCFSEPFLLCPLPPNNVESTENDLNAWRQHCIGGRGKEENTSFLRFIAFLSLEFWPGLSENLFGRKLSFKLYETWLKVADSLVKYRIIFIRDFNVNFYNISVPHVHTPWFERSFGNCDVKVFKSSDSQQR